MDELSQLRDRILELTAEYGRLKCAAAPPFDPERDRVNYAGRVFDAQELVNVVDAGLEFWLTWGRYSREFERRLAEFLGVRYALSVNSGSSANLLAFMALTAPELGERRIRRGDEVITVAAAFPTTVAPIVQYGAVPVFVDVRADGNLDPELLESARGERTRAVMLAHSLGIPFDLDQVKSFCDRHGLWLLEDNCDALGSRYRGQYTGSFGDLGTSSFYPPHHLTMGEGGAVYTDNPQLKKILLSLRDWGRDCCCESGEDNRCGRRFEGQYGELPPGYDHKYVYSRFGYNLKITDLQAAVGCAQLDKLPGFIAARRQNFAFLHEALADCREFLELPETPPESEPAYFGFLLTRRADAPFTRNELAQYLEAHRIQTRNLFAGNLTRHPCFEPLEAGRDYRLAGPLPVTDRIMLDSLWIGVYPGMTPEKLAYMADTIHQFCRERSS